MATKEELSKTNKNVANLQVTVNAIQTDIRSFKEDTQHNFDRLEKRMDDSDHTLMSFDKRIEFLETKALV
jgi:gas vesicle protein